jgi:hypothetical protein
MVSVIHGNQRKSNFQLNNSFPWEEENMISRHYNFSFYIVVGFDGVMVYLMVAVKQTTVLEKFFRSKISKYDFNVSQILVAAQAESFSEGHNVQPEIIWLYMANETIFGDYFQLPTLNKMEVWEQRQQTNDLL